LILDRIDQGLQQLELFPASGRMGRHSHELVVLRTPYIIAYDLTSSGIELLAILHGARLWPDQF
jgi:toxin ParE1/3/4